MLIGGAIRISRCPIGLELTMALVFLVCLISSPDTCKEERFSFAFETMSDLGCMMDAPPRMADWTNTHPGWRVARWKCIPKDMEEIRTI
jgi:hypothetical protein